MSFGEAICEEIKTLPQTMKKHSKVSAETERKTFQGSAKLEDAKKETILAVVERVGREETGLEAGNNQAYR